MMTKTAIGLVSLVFAFACGGVAGEEALITPTGDEPGEFETSTQEWVIDNGVYGFMALGSGGGNPRCNMINNGINCYVPPDKVVKYKVDCTGLSAGQCTDWQGSFDGSLLRLANDYPGWTLSRVTSGTVDVTIKLVDGNPATNKNSIHTYVYASPTGLSALDDQGRTGTFNTFTSLSCEIDRTNIVRDFTSGGTPSQQTRVLNHAMDVCFGLGTGTGTSGGVNRPHAIVVTPNAFKVDAPTDFAKCLAANYITGGATLVVRGDFEGLAVCSGLSDN